MSWQALSQQQDLQAVCPPGLAAAAAAAGLSSPISGSYSSSDTKDPAVAELEQFMMQELAAAGMMAMDSSSANALPSVQPAVAAAPQQPCCHQACLPPQQHARTVSSPALPQQLDGVIPSVHTHCHSSAAYAAGGSALSCMSSLSAPGVAAAWVPASAAGGLAHMSAARHVQQGVVPTTAAAAAAAAGPAAADHGQAAVRGRARAQMMARLEERLQFLSAQMGDMQLMLRLLQDA
jgi:hypothetical protein